MREIGIVKQVQIQRSSLKVGEEPRRMYDPNPLMTVDALLLSPEGIMGLTADGAQIIDVHHVHHPGSRYRGDNPISVNFVGHYTAMQEHFGKHLFEGIAGENILVEALGVRKLSDLGKRLAFQNADTGAWVYLDQIIPAPPCEPFSRFALCQSPPVLAATMKATLQFLGDGMRGFYAFAQQGTIAAGDKVFIGNE